MKVLVAGEYSGVVRDAFKAKGHDAWSCDLLPTDAPGQHIQGDVLEVLDQGWDLMIGHPPCTYLTNSAATHLYLDGKKENGKDEGRWELMRQGAEFFNQLWRAPVQKVCIENPIMVGHAKELLDAGKQTQVVQPWMFGHMEQKATCLWLRELPKLQPTNNVYDEMMQLPDNVRQRLHYLPPSQDRWKLRSTTYKGIAEAMAEQWGDL